MRYLFFLLGASIFLPLALHAQVAPRLKTPPIPIQETLSLSESLPPLDSLIDIALENSPVLRQQAFTIEKERQEFKAIKKSWMNRISSDIGYAYSNSFSSLLLNSPDENASSNTFTQGDNYRAGIVFRLNLFDVLGNRHKRKAARQELEIARNHRQSLETDIILRVKILFEELLLAEALFKLSSQKKQALFAQKEMAERSFRHGQINIGDLARVTELATNSEESYLKARLEVAKAYKTLLSFVGLSS